MLRVVAVMALAVGLAGAVAAYQILFSGPKPPVVAISQAAAVSFDQKVASVKSAVSAGGKQPVRLTLSEQEISSKVQQSLDSAGVTDLREVVVKLGEGTATVYAIAALEGMDIPVEVGLRMGANRGLLSAEVTSLKTANIDLPDSVRRRLTERATQAMGLRDLSSIDLGIEVQRVVVTPGQLQVEGETRGSE